MDDAAGDVPSRRAEKETNVGAPTLEPCESNEKLEADVSFDTSKLSRLPTIEPEVGVSITTLGTATDKTDAGSEPSFASVLSDLKRRKLTARWTARRVVLSAKFQLFMLAVLCVDLCALIVEVLFVWTVDDVSLGLEVVIWVSNYLTLCVYFSEVALGVYGFGLRNFCRDVWNIVDVVVLTAALVLTILDSGPTTTVVMTRALKFGKHAKFLKIIGRVLRCVHIAQRTRQRKLAMRTIVSKNKFRYLDLRNNIDLDLTYISGELIAMGAPASGCVESMYRNPLLDVARFFKHRHYGHFRIYNMCPELPYSDEPFKNIGGSVKRFEIEDHTPPKMEHFIDFLEDAREFKSSDAHNTLAVHCKAGKGRTGSFCCAWLLYSRKCKTADRALELFARRRTDQRISGRLRGVETPSQVRYVRQLWQHLERTDSWFTSACPPPAAPVKALELREFELAKGFLVKPSDVRALKVLIQSVDAASGKESWVEMAASVSTEDVASRIDLHSICVTADVRISLFEDKSKGQAQFSAKEAMKAVRNPFKAKGLLAFFTFHTGFVDMIEQEAGVAQVLAEELDNGPKRIKQGIIHAGTFVRLHFSAARSNINIPKEVDDGVV